MSMLSLRLVGLRQRAGNMVLSQRIYWTLNPSAHWFSTAAHISQAVPRRIPVCGNCVSLAGDAILKTQIRKISVQPLSASAESSGTQRSIDNDKIHNSTFRINELAAEVSAALENESAPVLSAWKSRICNLCAEGSTVQNRTGVIYLDDLESYASTVAELDLKSLCSNELTHTVISAVGTAMSRSKGPVFVEIGNQINIVSPQNSTETFDLPSSAKHADVRNISFMSVSAAHDAGYSDYIGWIFSCSRLVVVASSLRLLWSLTQTKPIMSALQLHPKVTILLDGIGSSKEVASAYTSLLHEALPMLGARGGIANGFRISVVPAASFIPRQHSSRQELLVSALSAAVSCIEAGADFTPQATDSMYRLATRSTAIADSLAPAFEPGSQKIVLSKLSSRIQNEFVGSSDLEAIDASIGTIKQRVQRWFSSGKIWKALFMNVEEVSDDLVEDTVLDRSFEDADLAMIHASGRLNESIRNSVSELAEALERLSYAMQLGRQAPVVPVVDPSVLGSAKGTLRALELRKEPASQFSLARHVWDTRRALAESDTLTGVPTYIRSSLTGFWAINSVSILAGIGSWIYLDASLVYASSGAVALAIISLTWLKYRWRQLSLQIYRHLDGQNAVLARKVIDAHSSELQSKLDQPVRDCIGGISGIQQLAEMDSMTGSGGTDGALVVNAASWRSRLELLVYA